MNKEKSIILGNYLFLPILFLVNPFICALLCIFLSLKVKKYKYMIWIICFFALINITIDYRQTDYSWYMPLFASAVHTSFKTFMFSLNDSKEQIYQLITYIISLISDGNKIVFSIFSTLLFYILSIIGVKKYCKFLGIDKKYGIFASLFLLLFPFIFANTANLLRQYYATGILICILPELLSGNKKYWIIAILDTFVHTSTGLAFALILLTTFLKSPFSTKSTITYAAFFIFLRYLSAVAGALLGVLGSSNVMTYILTKASTETTFEIEYTISKLIFSAVITVVPMIVLFFSKEWQKNNIITRFFVMQFFFFIFIAVNLEQAELCMRLNIFLWCFMPITVLIFCNFWKLKKLGLFTFGLTLLFVMYQLYFTGYTYYCKEAFLYQPSLSYFLQSKLY